MSCSFGQHINSTLKQLLWHILWEDVMVGGMADFVLSLFLAQTPVETFRSLWHCNVAILSAGSPAPSGNAKNISFCSSVPPDVPFVRSVSSHSPTVSITVTVFQPTLIANTKPYQQTVCTCVSISSLQEMYAVPTSIKHFCRMAHVCILI